MAHRREEDAVMKTVLSKRKRDIKDNQGSDEYTEDGEESCDSDDAGSVYLEANFNDQEATSDEDKKYPADQQSKKTTNIRRRFTPLTWGQQQRQVVNAEKKEELLDMVINRGWTVAYAAEKLDINPQLGYDIMNEHLSANGLIGPGSRHSTGWAPPNLEVVHTRYLQDLIDNDQKYTIEALKNKLESSFPSLKSLSVNHVANHLSQKLTFTMLPVEKLAETGTSKVDVVEQRRAFATRLHHGGVDYRTNCVYVGDMTFVLMMVSGKTRSKKNKPQYVVSQAQYKRLFTMYAAVSFTGELDKSTVKIGQFSSHAMASIVRQLFDENPKVVVFTAERIASEVRGMLSPKLRSQLVVIPSAVPLLDPIEVLFSEFRTFMSREPLSEDETLTDRMTTTIKSISNDSCQAWYARLGEYLAN